jgi:type IV conjugative transfer system protein TraE
MNNNALKIAVIVLAAVIAIEAVFIIKALNSEKTIIVPNVSGKYVIGGSSANPAYIKSTGTYLVSLIENFTPQTIGSNYKKFLGYASPQSYGLLQSTLVSNEKTYKRNDASSFFSIKSEKVYPGKLVIIGQDRLIIGSNVVSNKFIKINLIYKIVNGEFEVTGYVEKNINIIG